MYRRRFVQLAGALIGVGAFGSTNVLGEGNVDEMATPPNSRRAPYRGNSLRSVAEPIPLEDGDVEEVTVTNDGETVTYWVVRHGVEYDKAVYREPARLGGSNYELGGSDSGSFWFGIAGPDMDPIAHQGQVNLYFRVADEAEDQEKEEEPDSEEEEEEEQKEEEGDSTDDEKDEEDDTDSETESVGTASPGRGRGRGNGNHGNGNPGNGRDNRNSDDEESDGGDDNAYRWVSLKAQFTSHTKDELLHVNGVEPMGSGEESDEDDEEGEEDEEDEESENEGEEGDGDSSDEDEEENGGDEEEEEEEEEEGEETDGTEEDEEEDDENGENGDSSNDDEETVDEESDDGVTTETLEEEDDDRNGPPGRGDAPRWVAWIRDRRPVRPSS